MNLTLAAAQVCAPLARGAAVAAASATVALAAPMFLGVNAMATGVGALCSGAQAASARNPGEAFLNTVLNSALCAGSAMGAGISALALPVTVPAAAVGGFVLEYFTSVPTIALMSIAGVGCDEHGAALLGLNRKYMKMLGGRSSKASAKHAVAMPASPTQCSVPSPAKGYVPAPAALRAAPAQGRSYEDLPIQCGKPVPAPAPRAAPAQGRSYEDLPIQRGQWVPSPAPRAQQFPACAPAQAVAKAPAVAVDPTPPVARTSGLPDALPARAQPAAVPAPATKWAAPAASVLAPANHAVAWDELPRI